MTQLRSYTTIEQSKKLAEILPIESADMQCIKTSEDGYPDAYRMGVLANPELIDEDDIPSWSLSALLDVINKDYYPNLFHDGETWNFTVTHHDDDTIKYDTCGDDPLDISYRMIIFLHEQKLL